MYLTRAHIFVWLTLSSGDTILISSPLRALPRRKPINQGRRTGPRFYNSGTQFGDTILISRPTSAFSAISAPSARTLNCISRRKAGHCNFARRRRRVWARCEACRIRLTSISEFAICSLYVFFTPFAIRASASHPFASS
jgi:hypothetical protein